jgi:hypothetical protein
MGCSATGRFDCPVRTRCRRGCRSCRCARSSEPCSARPTRSARSCALTRARACAHGYQANLMTAATRISTNPMFS